MNLAEELARLAELRDKGILTEKEFAQKKKQLLKGGKAGPTRLMQFAAGLVVVVILGSFAYTGLQKWLSTPDDNELACDSPEVKETATNVLNQQISELKSRLGIFGELALPGTQIHGIGAAEELHRDKESGFIACLATARTKEGESRVAYTVSWQDRAIGKFWVELANPTLLERHYRGGPDQAQEQAPAPQPTPTPEPAPQEIAAETVAPAQVSPEPSPQPVVEQVEQQTVVQAEQQAEEPPVIAIQEPAPIPKVGGRRAAFIQNEKYGEISLYDSYAGRCSAGSRNAVNSGTADAPPSRGCWAEDNGVVRVTFHGPATGTMRFREEEFTRDPSYDNRTE